MTVPATDVLEMIQRSLCLIGNASEFISQARRSKVLEAIKPSHGAHTPQRATGPMIPSLGRFSKRLSLAKLRLIDAALDPGLTTLLP